MLLLDSLSLICHVIDRVLWSFYCMHWYDNDDDDDKHDVENSDFKDLEQYLKMDSDFGNDTRVI